jgi:hypothetical protein
MLMDEEDEEEDERYLRCWRWERVLERLENDGSRNVPLFYFAFAKIELLRL